MIILYNRIPKTGSTTVANLLYNVCEINQFYALFINTTKNSHLLTYSNQVSLAKNITNWKAVKPAFYHGHIAYLDFDKYGYKQPIYINFVREPIDRLVSYYYFLRFGDDYRPHIKRSRMNNKHIQLQSFDECVTNNGADCDAKHLWLQIPFFCGHASYCWQEGNVEALHTAKRNAIEKYAFVGITEDIRGAISILESMYPRFFAGTSDAYDHGGKLSHLRQTKQKKPILPQTRRTLESSDIWKMENEFYEFIKQNYLSNVNYNQGRGKSQIYKYIKIRPVL